MRVLHTQKNISEFIGGIVLLFVIACFIAQEATAADSASGADTNSVLLTIEGKVELLRFGATDWTAAETNKVLKAGDQVRTAFRSRATLRLSDLTVMRMNQLTTLLIQAPKGTGGKPGLDLKAGAGYFFGRDRPSESEFRTPQTSGAILGTEFALEVTPDGRTIVTLIDGVVQLNAEQGQLQLNSGEQGLVQAGQPPRKTSVIDANSIIQWSLYYPAILDPSELGLSAAEQQALATSLTAYRVGSLPSALASYPEGRTPASTQERIYLAQLVLAAGQVTQAEEQLSQINPGGDQNQRLGAALRLMIAAVKGQEQSQSSALSGALATELLAASYYHQSRFKLTEALTAARAATVRSADFGYAWERVAELEFGHGRADATAAALDKALQLSPRNAQGIALKGFVLAAQNKIAASQETFDAAIAVDGALGNSWLGRGLTKIRQGRSNEGRLDLQVAATLEPQRALLRSYLGKAFGNAGDPRRAAHELELAKKFDPNDPTSWLYSALIAQQQNEINRGVSDLEKSQELNDNRRLFRSRLLLDQDRAVRGANLASLYRDAGMNDLARREAARAVDANYANYSAHLFLAETYDALRDPNQVNLRYEAPWLNELLLANLLAPVGAGPLSQNVSQQEYSRLLERDRLGVSASTEYLSRGEWNHYSSQFGTFGNTSYAIDAEYHTSPGQRLNNDREQLTLYGKFKQQLTPQDSLLIQTIYYDAEAGDLAQYYDPATASPTLRLREQQEPNVLAGWHHEWSPESHTILLVGRLHDDFSLADPTGSTLTFNRNTNGIVTSVVPRGFSLNFGSQLEAFTSELQHILQKGNHTLIAGGRAQLGSFDNQASLRIRGFPGPDVFAPTTNNFEYLLRRFSVYVYDHWQILDSLRLTAGLTFDHLQYPGNSEIPPLSRDDKLSEDKISPKAAIEWSPTREVTVRGAYTRSLGGIFFDQSVRLEPTQLAGFNQTFRSLIPESVAGLVPGTEFETGGAAIDLKLPTRTYLSVVGEILTSDGERTTGTFDRMSGALKATSSSASQTLEYRERSFGVIVNQLAGQNFSFGASYRLSEAELQDAFTGVPSTATATGGFAASRDLTGTMHEVILTARFHHRCGFFSEADALWLTQSNSGYTTALPGDDFWQVNLYAGYRFRNRIAEVRLGLLNVTDQDYRLNPLNLYRELPRERTLAASLKLNF